MSLSIIQQVIVQKSEYFSFDRKNKGTPLKRGWQAFFFSIFLLIVAQSNTASLQGAEASSRHVAVVCPCSFQDALTPWINYRQNNGYTIHVLTAPLPTESSTGFSQPVEIRGRIRELAKQVPLEFLLLIGRGNPVTDSGEGWDIVIPAARVPAQVIQRFAKEESIASDAWYADLNDDNFPDLAVGRIPAASPQELSDILNRTIAYEKEVPSGPWQRKVNIIAGVGGFSSIIDKTIEIFVRRILTEILSPAFDLSLTNANWRSPFCPYPPLFRDVTISRINEGCLFWVYLGHGQKQRLDYLSTPNNSYHILSSSDSAFVRCDKGPPILLLFACHTGIFDVPGESLGSSLLLAPNGPVSILAASRLSMPYAMSVLALEMLEELEIAPEKLTIGEMIFKAKRQMMVPPNENSTDQHEVIGQQEKELSSHDRLRLSVDDIAKVLDPSARQLHEQLDDHVHLLNLLGDPLLSIRFPQKMVLESPAIAYASKDITVSGKVPCQKQTITSGSTKEPSEVLVELVLERNRSTVKIPRRVDFSPSEQEANDYQNAYFAANDFVVGETKTTLTEGEFSVTFEIPADAFGAYVVRASCLVDSQYYITGNRLTVRSYDAQSQRPSIETINDSRN